MTQQWIKKKRKKKSNLTFERVVEALVKLGIGGLFWFLEAILNNKTLESKERKRREKWVWEGGIWAVIVVVVGPWIGFKATAKYITAVALRSRNSIEETETLRLWLKQTLSFSFIHFFLFPDLIGRLRSLNSPTRGSRGLWAFEFFWNGFWRCQSDPLKWLYSWNTPLLFYLFQINFLAFIFS